MARPESLVAGNCYFSVGFYDQDLVLPMIDTGEVTKVLDDPEFAGVTITIQFTDEGLSISRGEVGTTWVSSLTPDAIRTRTARFFRCSAVLAFSPGQWIRRAIFSCTRTKTRAQTPRSWRRQCARVCALIDGVGNSRTLFSGGVSALGCGRRRDRRSR